jgi:hypothetical protein
MKLTVRFASFDLGEVEEREITECDIKVAWDRREVGE